MHKARQLLSTGRNWDVEKVHAVVAQSKIRMQNVQNTPFPEHFCKLRCSNSGCCCGAEHTSKCTGEKHLSIGALLEVESLKKCTRLWREPRFEINMQKHLHIRTNFEGWDVEKCTLLWRGARSQVKSINGWRSRTTFGSWDVEKVHEAHSKVKMVNTPHIHHMFGPLLDVELSFCGAGAIGCAPCQKWAKRDCFLASAKTMTGVGRLKIWTALHSTALHYTYCTATTTTTTTPDYNYTNYNTPRYSALHDATLHYTKLHCTTTTSTIPITTATKLHKR